MNDPYQSAVRAYLEGRYKEAECVCKELLKRHPKAHPALQLLALVEKRRGKHKLAVKNFRKAIQMAPEEAMYWNNLGETYREMGSIGEALDCYRKAVQYRGGYAEAHSNWGIALMAIGRHAEAEQQLTRAIQLNPQLSNAYFNLGVLHTDTGDMEQARQAYEHVLRLEPANTDALVNLAYVEKEHGRPDRALAHYLRAIEIDPSHFEAHLNLGNLYYHEGRYLEASQHSRKATELNPGSFDAWNGLGHTLNKQGHHKEAGNAFRQAHALDRRSPEALLGLAETRLHLHDRPGCLRALEQCEEVITGDDPRLHGQRAEFHLSGGDLAAAEAEARRCLTLDGNDVHAHQLIGQLKRFQDPDDPDLKRMRELFQRGVLSTSERYTLAFTIARALEQAGEYDTAFEYLQQANRLQRATFDYDIGSTRRYVDALCEFYTRERIGRVGPAVNEDATPIFIVGMPRSGTSLVEQILASHPAVEGAGELDDFEWLYLRRCGVEQREMLPGHFDALTRDSYRRIAAGYLAALRERHPRARRVTDKMPTNFFHLAAIRMALPNATIIHCSRDPMDTCLSIYQQSFLGFHPYAYDLEELGQYYRLYARLMEHWREVLGDGFHTVRYEDLVADQEHQTRALLDYCGLDFDPACLEFHKTDRTVLTSSIAQVRRPIYRSSIKRWQRYGHHLEPLRRALGLEDKPYRD